MQPTSEARARLASQQAALVRALVAGGEPPPGFDAERLQVAAAALIRKRARTVARIAPPLASELKERFDALFVVYAAASPLPGDGGPLADGRAFARWLQFREPLPDSVREWALTVDVRWRRRDGGLVRRRGVVCAFAWLPQARRLRIAVVIPWLGERMLSIPFGRRRVRSPGENASAVAAINPETDAR